MRLGLISDTHGLLRGEVFDALAGVDHILHAGDVGDEEILLELGAIAPVQAVWGNTDRGEIRSRLAERLTMELGGWTICVVHGQQYGSPTPRVVAEDHPDADLVVFGHSHQPVIERVGRVLAVNPGSAGPRRFNLPVTLAVATLDQDEIRAELISLVD